MTQNGNTHRFGDTHSILRGLLNCWFLLAGNTESGGATEALISTHNT